MQDLLLLDLMCNALSFYGSFVLQVLGQNPKPMYEKLVLNNVSSQSLSLELCLMKPFSLCGSPEACGAATTKVLFRVNLK